MTPLLEVRNLSFSYGKRDVFRRISFEIDRGAVACLLGPNGCGKTTLIDSALGFLQPSEGDIFLSGRPVPTLNSTEKAKSAAYVPQHHDKHFPYTVFDVILMGRTAHLGFFDYPGKEDRRRVIELLEKAGLSSFANRDYRELSGGETRMILILRALAQDAPLIVMDEPTSHLDFKNELVLMEKIMTLVCEEKRGVFMSTHSPNQALFLANRGVPVKVLLMGGPGQFLSGDPESILTEENMETFYGIRAARLRCPETELTSLIPLEIIKK